MYKVFIFFCFLFFLACETRPKSPNNCLSKEKMAELLSEMIITEAAFNTNILNNGIPDSSAKISILKSHDITYKNFEDSYKYYCYEPEDLKAIYDIAQEIIISKKQTKHF